MPDLTWIALTVVGVVLALPLIQTIGVFIQLLRLPLWPLRLTAAAPSLELSDDQRAAAAEVESLGFHASASQLLENGPHRHGQLLFRHESAPALATLTFQLGVHAGYPVTFYSFAADGRILQTINRTGWTTLIHYPDIATADAFADDLASHWQTHLARLAGLALTDIADAAAQQRINDLTEDLIPRLQREAKALPVGDCLHLSAATAARTALAWFRVRRKLARPYRSAITSPEHQSAFFANSYLQMEAYREHRSARRDVKAWLLAISLTVSLLLWAWLFDWQQAVALVTVLLVHELGHALAMRAFGYGDMSMFFLPFLGAMVTGSPKDMAAWKQAVMLLAGPVPGLLAGAGLLLYGPAAPGTGSSFDWQALAAMAIAVNLFNLLPITPLDGGRLLEVCLFARWPGLRLVFVLVSVCGFFALAYWGDTPSLWFIAFALGAGVAGQWRIVRLQRAWRDDLGLEQQLVHLFEVARRNFRIQTFARQYALIKAVLTHRAIHRPRVWESVLALGLMIGLWSAVGAMAYEYWPAQPSRQRAEAPKSPAQLQFDQVYSEVEEAGDEGDLSRLEQTAQALDAADPRHCDLAVLKARAIPPEDRRNRLEGLLGEGKGGVRYSLDDIADLILSELDWNTQAQSPQLRAAALQDALERIDRIAPTVQAGTLDARLRMAEAVDQSGDSARALALLQQLREPALATSIGHRGRAQVLLALSWFYLSQGRSADALALLQSAEAARPVQRPLDPLALAYAWALLESGRIAEGLAQMRLASYAEARKPKLLERLASAGGTGARLVHPLEMAYALVRADRLEEAGALIAERRDWYCQFRDDAELAAWVEPWQQTKERELRKLKTRLCSVGGGGSGMPE